MEKILEIFKNYFGIAFILLILSYLTPRENYRKYLQFFISVLIAVILFLPLTEWINKGSKGKERLSWEDMEERLSTYEYKMEGEDLFEIFGEYGVEEETR